MTAPDDDFDWAVTWGSAGDFREGVEQFYTRAEAEAWMNPETWETLPPDGFHLVYRSRWTCLVDGETPSAPQRPAAEAVTTIRQHAVQWRDQPALDGGSSPLTREEAVEAIAEFPDDGGVLVGRDVTIGAWTAE